MAKAYTARSIDVLEGLEPVRKRPGMYIGGTGVDGLHHLLWEIVDNAIDEAINEHATTIKVTLHPDGLTATVEDNGRGIPVDIHPKVGISALQVILTTLHSGAKFGDEAYLTSGGLHGVGASVVNALSSKLEVRVRRDGEEYVQSYVRGRPTGKVTTVGPARGTGTTVTFTPDNLVFGNLLFEPERILQRLETKSYLHKGTRLVFKDLVNGATHDLKHDGGLQDWLAVLLARESLKAVVDAPFVVTKDVENGRMELAITWTDAPRERVASYVNGIYTRDGGTHEQGFKDGLVKAVRNFADTHELSPRNLSITAEDLREGVVGIASLYFRDPQFQGQTKDRLNNPEARGIVDGALRPALEQWLHENRSRGEAIVFRAVQAARARLASRQAADEVRRKTVTSGRLGLPGKLADCSSSDPAECELFVVEGDSAGGSAKQGRDRKTQAVLPLRGKVLNTEQSSMKKVLENEELRNIATAIGTGIGEDLRLERLRYHRIILLMDADSDGHHITTLLLTFLFRWMPALIDNGFIYIAQPPLYKITTGKDTWWARDDREKEKILKKLSRQKPEITRFKGLGEMPPKTLFETTLDPAKRTLIRVTVPDRLAADGTVAELMGKDAQPRYQLLMEHAGEVDSVDV